jgi:major membrane immunogen (membrane-anchored lipoprotein)
VTVLMRRRISCRRLGLVGIVLVASLMTACTPTEPAEGALLTSSGAAVYTDGTYVVSYSHTGTDGWQPYLQLHVHAGLIAEVCFGAVNAAGSLIQDDEDYREHVRLDAGVDVLSLITQLENLLIAEQQLRFEVPAAHLDRTLSWSIPFVILADAALDLARTGEVTTAVIPAAGPYIGHDQPDELGWEARIIVAFDETGVIAASFEERRIEADGSEMVRAADPAYAEAYQRVLELTPAAVADQLSRQLVAQGAVGTEGPVAVDGLTGATGTSNRFQILANEVVATRVAVPLPHKLCAR